MADRARVTKISFTDEADLVGKTGILFVHELYEDSSLPSAQPSLPTDKKIIEAWLGCAGKELTAEYDEKIACAWRRYYSLGISPSLALQPSFQTMATLVRRGKKTTVPLPSEVIGCFDRMLATDKEIAVKRLSETLRKLRERTPQDNESRSLEGQMSPYFQRIRSRLANLSRIQRGMLSLSIAWAAFVCFRTYDSHYLFGHWFAQWSEKEFFMNLLLPPVVLAGALAVGKWVTKGH